MPYLNLTNMLGPVFTILPRSESQTEVQIGDVEKYTNYVVIHAVAQNLISYKLDGQPETNKKYNIPMLSQLVSSKVSQIHDNFYDDSTGQIIARKDDRGELQSLILSLSFSKTDSKYLREARYANANVNHLTLLGNVYDTTIVLKGVLFLYPGQMIFIDPGIETAVGRGKQDLLLTRLEWVDII